LSCIKNINFKVGDLISYKLERYNNMIEIVYCIVCNYRYNEKKYPCSKNIVEWIDIDVLFENKVSSIIINSFNTNKIELIQSY